MNRLLGPALLALSLSACVRPGDEISFVDLESGSYRMDADSLPAGAPDVTLELDMSAGTYSISEDGGETFSGAFTTLPEDKWTQCCYLNGAGHTRFETIEFDAPFVLEMAGVDMAVPRITADGASSGGVRLFDAEDGDENSADGFAESYTFDSDD